MHIATRISHHRHNYLAIVFGTVSEKPISPITILPPQSGCDFNPLDVEKVLDAVLRGVEEGNKEFGTDYVVHGVQFVEDDTGPEGI